LFGIGFVPPPPRGPRRRKPKPGEQPSGESRRQELSASLAGAKDMVTVFVAVAVIAVLVVLVVTLSSLRG
jgi:hypothetical protein